MHEYLEMDSQKRPRPAEEASEADGGVVNERSTKMPKLVTKIGTMVQKHFLALGTADKEAGAQKGNKQSAAPTSSSKGSKSVPSVAPVMAATGGNMAAEVEAEMWRLHPTLIASIRASGLASFFPIQREVVPVLCSAEPGEGGTGDDTLGDVSVSAPTGSGKTLVYVLPILNYILRQESTSSLAALVLLPTRELASQVASVFATYANGSEVRIGVLAGARSFTEEQAMIEATAAGDKRRAVSVLVATPGRLIDHMDRTPSLSICLSTLRFLAVDEADRLLAESYSGWAQRLRDALTPATVTASDVAGRYTSAIDDLPSAASAVVTESDLASVANPSTARLRVAEHAAVGHRYVEPLTIIQKGSVAPAPWLRPVSWLQPSDASTAVVAGSRVGLGMGVRASPMPVPLRRIVCSATLTSNPQKLAALGLDRPMHFVSTADVRAKHTHASAVVMTSTSSAADVGEDARGDDGKRLYSLPASLHHAQVVVSPDNKPIALLQLLRLLEGQGIAGVQASEASAGLRAVVFTNGVETAHRLCRLLQLYGGLHGRVVEFSANLTSTQRSAVLTAVSAGAISVMVTSDAAARGLDLPSLPAVINYDCPSRIKTYVHRSGRTARAGRLGLCYTLISADQARHFRLMTRRITHASTISEEDVEAVNANTQRVMVAKETLLDSTISSYAPRLMQVLHRLKKVLEAESNGTLLPTKRVEPLGADSHEGAAQAEGLHTDAAVATS